MDRQLEIALDTEAQGARLLFRSPSEATGPSGQLIDGTCLVAQGPLRLEYGFVCFGYDLDQFTTELRRLHATLAGEARFINQEGNVEVRFTVAAAARGRHAVSITLEQDAEMTLALRGENLLTPQNPDARLIKLTGFFVEQSYLPGIASAIERFLSSTGVDRAHPMVRAPEQS